MAGMPCHALTVDVEEWFHICGIGGPLAPAHWPSLESRVVANTTILLDLLDRCRVRATFFVLGYVAERHPDLVRRILAAGHEVGSHGQMHDRVYDLTPAAFEQDLDRSRTALAACGASDVRGFRAPEWSINDRSLWALDVLVNKGFAFDSSMAPMRIIGNPEYPQAVHRRDTKPGSIVECPPAVARRLGHLTPFGGGWGLRMSRPRAVLRALEQRARAGQWAVLWVHPWELDDEPPRIKLPMGKAFAHYAGLSGFRARFEAILRGMAFGPLGPLAAASEQS
jgi:polysaccharide deacetylase family protein (PEP-CTERM system associated)